MRGRPHKGMHSQSCRKKTDGRPAGMPCKVQRSAPHAMAQPSDPCHGAAQRPHFPAKKALPCCRRPAGWGEARAPPSEGPGRSLQTAVAGWGRRGWASHFTQCGGAGHGWAADVHGSSPQYVPCPPHSCCQMHGSSPKARCSPRPTAAACLRPNRRGVQLRKRVHSQDTGIGDQQPHRHTRQRRLRSRSVVGGVSTARQVRVGPRRRQCNARKGLAR